ncbi:hypothetical protein L210DRAFT_3633863 [Boletus edulis BED1]|uniref:Uncharacterized protein n=1 Tax=Boletus edulis BED1 TaxID=1328754 RepID=A0AAD4BI74_BOLED|nr:hypothetical protein L210DRAFT_3633863 [Boletus edulis BED1]
MPPKSELGGCDIGGIWFPWIKRRTTRVGENTWRDEIWFHTGFESFLQFNAQARQSHRGCFKFGDRILGKTFTQYQLHEPIKGESNRADQWIALLSTASAREEGTAYGHREDQRVIGSGSFERRDTIVALQ